MRLIINAACFFAVITSAHGQIFGGVSDAGTVVLSNTQSEEAKTLIVAGLLINAPDKAVKAGTRAPLLYTHSAKKFLPFIDEASSVFRLPVELIHAVIAVESNYNPHAVSPKGALGLMQIMPATALRFGTGDAFDPRHNILTGSRYLRWLLDQFNQNMELALAGYNAGEGAVVKAGYRIPPYTETMKYVPNVLAHYLRAL